MESVEEAKLKLEKDKIERLENTAKELKNILEKYKTNIVGVPTYQLKGGEWKLVIEIQISSMEN